MSWILTYSGREFDLLEPTAAMVAPVDIAHALAVIPRFNGHTLQHYSVAQHSLMVADQVPAEHRLAAMLHDAAEAYVGDMTSPLKALVPNFQHLEHAVWLAVCERFDIDPILPQCVHMADLQALATERRDLMRPHPADWECLRGVSPLPQKITPRPVWEIEVIYFNRLLELMQADHGRRFCA